ncbi:MAG: GNAT family N-acetyltransferase [Deltaproteobacteria bacterium]|nr:GNAT family N-acetyltransferase [Deltaproteobacteria bacterium]
MSLRYEVVADAERLRVLAEKWRALQQSSDQNSPMNSPEWLLTWWDLYAPLQHRTMMTLAVFDQDRLVGLLPLSVRHANYQGLVPIDQLEAIGCGERDEDSVCSCYIGPISARGFEQAVAEQAARWLTSSDSPKWQRLTIDEMMGESAFGQQLVDELNRRGIHAELRDSEPTHVIELPKTFDAYVATLSKKSRYLVRRTVRDFEKWAENSQKVDCYDGATNLEAAFDTLETLHRERWSRSGQPGAFASQVFRAFHRRVVKELGAHGRLVTLSAQGQAIAALYQILWNNRVYVYQSGRVIDGVPATIRPGLALHIYAIRSAIDEGFSAYDLLCGAARYKRQLGATEHTLQSLEVRRPSLRSTACDAADRAIDLVRSLRRRITGPHQPVAADDDEQS